MNSKEFKVEKKEKKSKSSLKNGDQEVYVLSPNLLQKLGINLGNVGNNSTTLDLERNFLNESDIQVDKDACSLSNTKQAVKNDNCSRETSILKTASLMTTSVFLSPSFDCKSNVSVSDVEKFHELPNPQINNDSKKSKQLIHQNSPSDTLEPGLLDSEILKKDHNGTDCALNLGIENNNLHIYGSTEKKTMLQREIKKTINIISDENITLEKFNQLKAVPKTASKPYLSTIEAKKMERKSMSESEDISSFTGGLSNAELQSESELCESKLVNNAIEVTVVVEKTNEKYDEKVYDSDNSIAVQHEIGTSDMQEQVCVRIDLSEEKNQSTNYKQVQFDKLNDNEEFLNSKIGDKNVDKSIVEIKSKLIQNKNNFNNTDRVKQTLTSCRDCTQDMKISNTSNNNQQKQLPSNDNLLLTKHSSKFNQEGTCHLETSIIVNCTQDLPCIINTNNNNCNDKESNFGQDDVLVYKDTVHVDNKTKCLMTMRHKDVTEGSSSKLDQDIKKTKDVNDSGGEQRMIFKKFNENVILQNDIKSSTSQFYSHSATGSVSKINFPLNPNRNNLMSKLCIQGVEKPGGINITDTISFKTYSNNKKNKMCVKHITTEKKILKIAFDHSYNIDERRIKTVHSPHFQQFCKCTDFGSLAYNLFDNSYEHIHYMSKRPLDCSLDVVFGIYDNNILKKIEDTIKNYDFVEDNTNQSDSVYAEHPICWHSADSIQHKFDNNDEEGQEQYADAHNKHSNSVQKRKVPDNSPERANKRAKIMEEQTAETGKGEQVIQNGFKGWGASHDVLENTHDNEANREEQVKCGVCGSTVTITEWSSHIATRHDYVSWKEGDTPVNVEDPDAVKEHLQNMIQELGQLVCSGCGLSRKYAKPFMYHIKNCNSLLNTSNDVQLPSTSKEKLQDETVSQCDKCHFKCRNAKDSTLHAEKCTSGTSLNRRREAPRDVTCGVCKKVVTSQKWITHIQRAHNYKAWEDGATPLNVEDEESVRKHLYGILQEHGSLICSKCGKSRKYVKLFLQHVESCIGPKKQDDSANVSYADIESIFDTSVDDNGMDGTKMVKCGVCQQEMEERHWLDHIQKEHNYVAWQEGKTPISVCDAAGVQRYLYALVQRLGALACAKCGARRRYVKNYLSHVAACTGPGGQDSNEEDEPVSTDTSAMQSMDVDESVDLKVTTILSQATLPSQERQITTVKCGVCLEEMEASAWVDHISMNHNYLAWKENEMPLDVEDEESVRKHLIKMLRDHGPLVCAKCGGCRKYVKVFQHHIETCTGPKELDSTTDTSYADIDSVFEIPFEDTGMDGMKMVKCGICQQEMEARHWLDHIQKEHNYLAWQEGKTPISVCDAAGVQRYLYALVQRLGALTCAKCGARRRYVKNYLSHVAACTGPQTLENTIIKCGVCQREMIESNWIPHISISHDYLAWKDTEASIDLNSYEAMCQHLTKTINEIGPLKCAECGKLCQCSMTYLMHIRSCYGKIYKTTDGESSALDNSVPIVEPNDESDEETEGLKVVKCGVCGEEMEQRVWIDHIRDKHAYLAWRDGEQPLELDNEEIVLSHLKDIVSATKRLTCVKCGLWRKKVLPFYTHTKTCDGTPFKDSLENQSPILKRSSRYSNAAEIVKCALCALEMPESLWIDHIAKEHEYMAWVEGDEQLDVNDEVAVRDHLFAILHTAGELICSKCGLSRKYVKSYLKHCKSCTISQDSTHDSFQVLKEEPTDESNEDSKEVTCGLCRKEMGISMWMYHVAREHNYVAWKLNDPPLVFDDETALRDYLYNIVQTLGSLVCVKCGIVRKYAKGYLQHIDVCQKVNWRTINKMIRKATAVRGDVVTCAVCAARVDNTEWTEHIASQHRYLAWRDRDTPLNLDDEEEVWMHLRNIIHMEGYLKCLKCGVKRKYPKLYLQHVNTCDGSVQDCTGTDDPMSDKEYDVVKTDDTEGAGLVKCGVCAEEVERDTWLAHIQRKHQYLAWQEGQKPLNVKDKAAVYKHLYAINLKSRGLTCESCGLVRKYVKAYLQHVRNCCGRVYCNSDEIVECGVCAEKVVGRDWKDHAMQSHYNVAWFTGETPLDVRNLFSVLKYLKEYQDHKRTLSCNICGLSRASLAGFYAHVLVCGKTEEEVESLKDVCEICNQKYLCIYKTQHYWSHKAQEDAKERKIQETLRRQKIEDNDESCTVGRRKAAQKARTVIGDYAAKLSSNKIKCSFCGLEWDDKDNSTCQRCGKEAVNYEEDSDDSDSVKMEDYSESEEESEYTDVDSDVSYEEDASNTLVGKKKRIRNETKGSKHAKYMKFPFEVNNLRPFIHDSKTDYLKLLHSQDNLFPHWRDFPDELVSEDLLPQYMPQLMESCKVTISNGEWTTYKRFESRREKGCKVLFLGASIQCVSWAAALAEGVAQGGAVLAAGAHRGADCPRLPCARTSAHPALLQFWDFGDFKCLPKLAFCLAHDYGTVWAMDWCPAGARDVVDPSSNTRQRLGLLAIACSNGSAYIVSVPYPDVNQTSDYIVYKLKPCVELRLTRGNMKYQATSINWSMLNGYTNIFVGYGDGTVATYDLVTVSPFLTAKEGDINILYPFQDERVHNSCVTGLTSSVLGAWCSASPTGAAAGVAAGARAVRAHSALAAGAAAFLPHWPSVLLSGDDTIVGLSPSELEWGCAGRRVGSVRALAPCVQRARVAALVPPLLQLLRPHPAACKGHKVILKKNVAMIDLAPLAKKRSKRSNDALSMKVEPITYEDAIASYGIEFKLERDFDKAFVQRMQAKQRVPYPERFPLADVPALAYCPAAAHCTQLAVPTHAGVLFIVDV